MNFLPFVSRARFADKEQRILDLQAEVTDLKYAYARVVDEINFRSTGFHIDERFVGKEVAVAAPVVVPQEELTGIGKVINEVGTRGSAIRRALEIQSETKLQEQEVAARKAREQQLQAEAARRLEDALNAGKPKAAQA